MYPSRGDYKVSVENEMYATDVNGGLTFSPVRGADDETIIASGGVATVFKVQDPAGKPKALKLFTEEISERFERFERLSLFLKEEDFDFMIEFTFSRNLIFVEMEDKGPEESLYPGLIMDWIDAPTLEEKLHVLLANANRGAISQLAEHFRRLSLMLLDSKVGHGDLKPSNMLVRDDLHLYLIDYDGMFIEPFKNTLSFELGTPSYQHPARRNTDFHSGIDHFSMLLIYTSLIALAADPGLIRFSDGDSLVIRQEDLMVPEQSEIFGLLLKMPETKQLTYFLKKSLQAEEIVIDNLQDLLNGRFPVPSLRVSHSPLAPAEGEEITVSWLATNSDFLTIDGLPAALGGSLTRAFSADIFLAFELGTEVVSVRRSYEILFDPGPRIERFKPDQQKVKSGSAVNLSWKVSYFSRLELTEGDVVTDVTTEKSATVYPLTDREYVLTAFGLKDHPSVSQLITVEVYQPVSVGKFAPDDDFLIESMSSHLRWEVFNAEEVFISSSAGEQFPRLKGGSLLVTPARTTTYALTAQNRYYNESKLCTIVVDPRPRIHVSLPKILPDKTALVPKADFKAFLAGVEKDSKMLKDALFRQPPKRMNLLETLNKLTGWNKMK